MHNYRPQGEVMLQLFGVTPSGHEAGRRVQCVQSVRRFESEEWLQSTLLAKVEQQMAAHNQALDGADITAGCVRALNGQVCGTLPKSNARDHGLAHDLRIGECVLYVDGLGREAPNDGTMWAGLKPVRGVGLKADLIAGAQYVLVPNGVRMLAVFGRAGARM